MVSSAAVGSGASDASGAASSGASNGFSELLAFEGGSRAEVSVEIFLSSIDSETVFDGPACGGRGFDAGA